MLCAGRLRLRVPVVRKGIDDLTPRCVVPNLGQRAFVMRVVAERHPVAVNIRKRIGVKTVTALRRNRKIIVAAAGEEKLVSRGSLNEGHSGTIDGKIGPDKVG